MRNLGQRTVRGYTAESIPVGMRYAVTSVQVPLDSVSQMCDSGSTVTFNKFGGKVTGPDYEFEFQRKGDTYVRTAWVETPVHSEPWAQDAPQGTETYAVRARRLQGKQPPSHPEPTGHEHLP